MGGGFTRIVAEGHGLSDCFFTRRVAESHGFLSRIVGFFFFFFSSHGESRKVTNYRIIELILSITRSVAEGHGFLSRIIEFSNFFFTRSVAEGHGFLSRDLSFGPTDQREVIIEFLSSHGESRRSRSSCPELSNYRIVFFTRSIAESHGFIVPRLVLWTH